MAALPAQPLPALRVLQVLNDVEASLAELGEIIELDPVLAARVMRLANSPAYGATAPVRSASRAVLLLGFATVKAVAAAGACWLLADGVPLGPPHFWAHSVTVASAASVSAELLGVAAPEAFTAGLLHDIGTALLHRRDPEGYESLLSRCPPGGLLDAERQRFDTDHAEVGAAALEGWGFPAQTVAVARDHHRAVETVPPVAQAVVLGHAVAERLERLAREEPALEVEDVLRRLGRPAGAAAALIEQASASVEKIRARLEERSR